jgi:hypothetical protein
MKKFWAEKNLLFTMSLDLTTFRLKIRKLDLSRARIVLTEKVQNKNIINIYLFVLSIERHVSLL